ncbi:GNAT family N-acetyltransferase [Evansella sp. AB-rgal1]|uniref:GNAT family N-acetyltransferase n=1 Tax=Evansella sp. AB-rgal1 TaxID=3242696 RepID=UPI00359E4ACF
MKREITFDHLYKNGTVIVETELYKQIHFPKMLNMYDANFIEFKSMPTLSLFIEMEAYLRGYHDKFGQKHVKFYFPVGEKLSDELASYLSEAEYETGFMELYSINPKDFPRTEFDAAIEVRVVSEENQNVELFLDLNYKHSLEYGKKFAEKKMELLYEQCQGGEFLKLLATYQGNPAGYVHVILSSGVAEIDDLHVDEIFQKKRIGTALQRKVMDLFSDRTILLIADGEDTPKEMYKKQNYHYLGFQYETCKVFELA